MKQIQIDGTDLSVSRLGFGTGALHHLLRRTERLRVLETAFDSGITHFDTSPYYGFGLAECDLGRFLCGKREKISIASKIGLYPPERSRPNNFSVWSRKLSGRIVSSLNRAYVDWSLETAEASLERTLKRCRTDFVDVLFLHEPTEALIDADEFLSWLEGRQAAGCVRYWGLAGESETVKSWTADGHGLARIIQTRDGLSTHEAEFVRDAGRELQFTYGYMSGRDSSSRGADTYAMALQRNSTGSIIFSTRMATRIADAARAIR